ncbi:MAG: glycerophosphoryl diester phosphodiesterase [Acidimicrobiaceae bacterium]|nr:glycerophosphoryl diester phosphodiesterase [Acidimicrobiaceae bacterium]
MGRGPLNYAHQGGAKEAPSSTLFAMRAALAAGADAIELDVHATRDGELVVCHDATVDATTDGTGRIADLTLAQVQALDNAAAWPELAGRAPEDRSLGVATLREVLEEFAGVILNLDIKQTSPDVPGYESALAALLREFGRVDDVIVASFLDLATDRFSAFAPDVPISAGTLATAQFWQAVQEGVTPSGPSGLFASARYAALQVPPAFQDTVVVDERFVAAAHAAGMAVHVWTIDEPDEMARLLDLGVDGIITDRPSVLAQVLATRR